MFHYCKTSFKKVQKEPGFLQAFKPQRRFYGIRLTVDLYISLLPFTGSCVYIAFLVLLESSSQDSRSFSLTHSLLFFWYLHLRVAHSVGMEYVSIVELIHWLLVLRVCIWFPFGPQRFLTLISPNEREVNGRSGVVFPLSLSLKQYGIMDRWSTEVGLGVRGPSSSFVIHLF